MAPLHHQDERVGCTAGDQEVERFKAKQLVAKLSPKTVNNQLTVLRKALVTAKKWRRIAYVPEIEWLKVTAPKFDFLNFDESPQLIAGADPEWRAMIVLGLRSLNDRFKSGQR